MHIFLPFYFIYRVDTIDYQGLLRSHLLKASESETPMTSEACTV